VRSTRLAFLGEVALLALNRIAAAIGRNAVSIGAFSVPFREVSIRAMIRLTAPIRGRTVAGIALRILLWEVAGLAYNRSTTTIMFGDLTIPATNVLRRQNSMGTYNRNAASGRREYIPVLASMVYIHVPSRALNRVTAPIG